MLVTSSHSYGALRVPAGPLRVTVGGKPVSPILPCADRAFAWIALRQGQSVAYALTFGGYGAVSIGAAAWPEEEATSLRRMARHQLTTHGHPWVFTDPADASLTRENCAACALTTIETRDTDDGLLQPAYCSWERVYVQAGRPVPLRFVPALEAELNTGRGYADALARDLATWGIRYTD